jgi:cytidylate kinase
MNEPVVSPFAFDAGERQKLPASITRNREALSRLVIAIDGPAGSGKTTTARRVAQQLALRHVDTGALYRALTLAALRRRLDPEDDEALAQLAASVEIRLESGDRGARVWLGQEEVTDAVRSPDVTARVSGVSALPAVRAAMLQEQRRQAARGGTVMEGRDIASVVLPDADLKVFLTADVTTRARRRQKEEAARGHHCALESIEHEIAARDHADSTRASAPLVRASDAIEVDTSSMALEEQVDAVLVLALRTLQSRRLVSPVTPSTDVQFDPQAWEQPRFRRYYHGRFRFAQFTIGTFVRNLFGIRREMHPSARVPGSLLVACNHISVFDPPLVGAVLPFEVFFVAKSELFRNPLLGRLIRAFNAYPIRRRTADFEALNHAVELLQSGHNVLMFPEGTRQRPGKLGPPRWGFGYVARRAGRPIVPVFVRGTRDMRPRGLRREPVEVWVGEPFCVSEPGDDQEAYWAIGRDAIRHIAGLMLRSSARQPIAGLEPEAFVSGSETGPSRS